jgi:hypothetical protein
VAEQNLPYIDLDEEAKPLSERCGLCERVDLDASHELEGVGLRYSLKAWSRPRQGLEARGGPPQAAVPNPPAHEEGVARLRCALSCRTETRKSHRKP